MKLTGDNVMQAVASLNRMAGQRMPPRAAYWVSRLSMKLKGEFGAIDKQRTELIQKHGVERPEGGWQVPQEKLAEFVADYEPILSEEIEVDIQPIRLEVFGDCQLAPADLIALGPLVVEA